MPYKLIFDDDSFAYLSHHGVKGMHWGVWNAETRDRRLGAKHYQKKLNRYDNLQQQNAMGYGRARETEQYYLKKAQKAGLKGNTDKQRKFSKQASIASNIKNEYANSYREVGEKYLNTISKMSSEGYNFKVTPTNFNALHPGYAQRARSYMNKHGRVFNRSDINSVSGNKWKVKDSISDKRKASWKKKHTIQSHRPQSIYYYNF